MALERVVVVGASLAGLRAVETLRKLGYHGRLTWIGAEPTLPYDRPPLSKEVLQGEWPPERASLRAAGGWDALALDLRLGRRALALDIAGRSVELDDGERVPFDGLVIATGASPLRLAAPPGLDGIHVLRTLEDCLAIRSALERSPRVAVVGAGFIGAEVAASCRARGLEVTVIEALPVPLGAALGPEIGGLLAAVHRDHGVDLRCGAAVRGFEGSGRAERVRLADGSAVEADLVVVGIGVRPETAWLAGSGVPVGDGVLCDETLATPVPGVVAAGDVARWPNRLFGESMRVEHWTNAVEQGMHAAGRLLAGASPGEPFAPVPFFWSDQYDAKLQLAGRREGADETRVVHGTLAERRFVSLFGRAGRLVGAFALNRARLCMRYRALIREGASFADAVRAAESD